MEQLPRHAIYPKDIELFTGKSRYTAYRMLENSRKKLGKSKNDPVTIEEYCRVTNTNLEAMYQIVKEGRVLKKKSRTMTRH